MSQQIIEGYQLSPQQKHLWSLAEGGEQTPYTAQCLILIEGTLDREILRTALRRVVERQEILRTSLNLLADMTMPLQVVHASGDPSVDELDLSDLSEPIQTARLETLLQNVARQHHNLEQPDQLSLTEVRLAPHKHVLLVSQPAMYADREGLKNLMGELAACYTACLNNERLPEEPIQYAALSAWQNESLEAEESKVGRDHWRTQESSGTPLRLPFEKDVPEEVGFNPGSPLSFTISPEVVGRLEGAGARHHSTLPSTLLASFYLLLSRLATSPHLTLGVGFDGRNYDELSPALGLFARFLPISLRLAPHLPFPDLLRSLDSALGDARGWQELYTPPPAGHLPFCFEYDDDPQPSAEVAGPLRFTLLRASAYVTRFTLLLRCLRRPDGSLRAEWHYDAGRLSAAEVGRLAGRWGAAVEGIGGRGGRLRVGEVEVVSAEERTEVLRRGRGARRAWVGAGCVHEVFAAQAARTPEAVAVEGEDGRLTYGELERRANQLARYLRGRGVCAEGRVGLMMGRGVEAVVGMLGVLKAGGAYVPLEGGAGRRAGQMARGAGVRVVVSEGARRAEVEALREWGVEETVYVDEEAGRIGGEGGGALAGVAGEGNLAYVIYTSGSTGVPKGVGIEHRQITNYLNAILERLNLPANASFALVSTFAADLGNTVIFPALCTGGVLHVISKERAADAGALADYFREHPIDCLKIVPSHLAALMTHPQGELVLPRKCLVLGGEASSWELIEKVQRLAPNCRVINHYGPTETTVGVLSYAVSREPVERESKTIPLGFPIANTQVYLLDPFLRPVPLGVPGELYIGGANVARGYLNSPETVAEKFIPDPFSQEPGARLYQTGDLARFLPNEGVEFLGRTDDQVKIRGFRTELGEIEAALRRHQGVEQVKVLARENSAGHKRLVAYIIPEASRASTVRHWLRLKRDGRLDSRHSYELPNGMLVASQNRNETDFMYREIFEEKIYLQQGIRLNDGDCVFDVGANVGMFSLFVGRTRKNVEIYAFEPIPPLYELLRANMALYGLNAKLFKCGVAAEATQEEFTYYPHLTLMSGRFADLAEDREVVKSFESNRRRPEEATPWDDELLDEVLAERMSSESFVCQMKRISDVIRDNQIERIDLLKIDVQKSEMDVLRGIDEDDWPKIKQVVLEVHDVDDRLHQITSSLVAHGFQVTVRQETMLKETGLFDVYCVRPGLAEGPSARGDDDRASESLPVWTSPDALTGDIRDYLKDNLPDYMIPSAFVLLENFPLTANGKIDRQALPEPDEAGAEGGKTFVPPGNETEEILAGIWRQVLGLPQVGVRDNFFELGGDSILSIQIVARAHQAGLKLSPKLLFRHQTIAELCAALADSGPDAPSAAAEQGLLSGALPLTPIQHYFFSPPPVAAHHFNQSLLLVLRRRLDVAVLQRALTALVSHHDALRLRFSETEGGWRQRYAGAEAVGEVVVQEVDVSRVSEGQQAAIAEACDRAQRSMRLEEGGLVRGLLFETGGEQLVLIAAHHLVVDGVSWRIMVEDLGRAIEQIERGVEVDLGKKTSSYRRWAERLEEYERDEQVRGEASYWGEIAGKGAKRIPVDFSDGLNTVESARTVSVSLDAEETRALLQEVPEAYRTQINDVLLTGVVEALGKWSGERQVLIDMEGHGREELWEDIDLSRTVGWFTTLFPVAFQVSPAAQAGARLKAVKEQLRRVPNRGIGYGLLRYLSKDAEISAALRALPQAELRFNYLGQLDNVLPPDSLFSWSTGPAGSGRDGRQLRAYLLDVSGAVSGGRLQLNVIYSENVHRHATIEVLGRGLLDALRAIISHCQSLETSELSPSDFPLAKLSQQQLDRIMSKTTAGGQSNEN